MVSSNILLTSACAALGAATVASAAAVRAPKGTFSLKQVRNPSFAGKSGPAALAKAYKKYKKPIPDYLVEAVANVTKRDTGSAETTPTEYDSEYLTPVEIGTPAQTLNLDFDTGSSDLWCFCSGITPSSEVDGQTEYNPKSSSSSKLLSGATWSITYGDLSSSSGIVYTDVVNVGGVSVSGQAVECAKKVSSEFTSDPSSGLLGLAFSDLNSVSPTPQNTFFDNAIDSLDSPLFTADLRHDEPGTYNFGYIDDSIASGSITYTSVDNSQGFWGFTSSGYAVGSATFKSTKTSGIADTGTTLLLLPDTIVSAYYAKVSGSKNSNSDGGYVFPCSATLPDFTYGIGSSKITIPGEYINYAPASGSNCYGGIQSDSDIGFAIYGDVALKAALVVFNGGDNTLGFAPKSV